jgi:uncharacterized protein involved in exopolysaccharide biosynthesis
MARQSEIRLNFLSYLLILTRWKRFLILNSILWVAAAVAASLLLPKSYTAQVVMMPPKSSSNGLSKLAKNLPMAKLAGNVGSLMSMGGSENLENIYLAILASRSLQMDVIHKFDLIHVYKFDRKRQYYIEDVLKAFNKHVGVEVTDEGTFVISVEDREPVRAADMANFMADRLDEIYKRLTVETEHNQRMFLEARLNLSKADLDSAETRYTQYLIDNRMLDIDEQAKATIEAGSNIEARYMAAELKLDLSRKIFASGNPKIHEQEMELSELKRQRNQMLKERKSDLLIPYRMAPEIGQQLIRLKRDLKVQEAIFEFIMQQYETSKFEEAKNTPVVQILDKAEPPQKKTFPKRIIIVLMAAAGSVVLGVGYATFVEYFRKFSVERPEDFRLLSEIKGNLWSKASVRG